MTVRVVPVCQLEVLTHTSSRGHHAKILSQLDCCFSSARRWRNLLRLHWLVKVSRQVQVSSTHTAYVGAYERTEVHSAERRQVAEARQTSTVHVQIRTCNNTSNTRSHGFYRHYVPSIRLDRWHRQLPRRRRPPHRQWANYHHRSHISLCRSFESDSRGTGQDEPGSR